MYRSVARRRRRRNGGSDNRPSKTFLINVTQVNQPPVNTVPGTQREIKDMPLVFSTAGYNRISVGDIDGFASTEEVDARRHERHAQFGATRPA